MGKEAYFSIGEFPPTSKQEITDRLGKYGYVVSVKSGQLPNDVHLGLVVHEDDRSSDDALVLAQAAGVPTLVIHKRQPTARRTQGQYHATRVDAYGLNPFLCYTIARSIVGDARLTAAIVAMSAKWSCSVKGTEILALLMHTSAHSEIARLTGTSVVTVKSHIRRLIKNAVANGQEVVSGQDLMRLVLWHAYGHPTMLIEPHQRRDGVSADDDEAADDDAA
jgi:DNA-binding CsgD family transcriptional regulator